MKFGKWAQGENVYGELDGGFPLVVFDSKMKTAAVLSPMNTFMTALQTSITSKKTNDTMLTFGPLSTIVEASLALYVAMETIVHELQWFQTTQRSREFIVVILKFNQPLKFGPSNPCNTNKSGTSSYSIFFFVWNTFVTTSWGICVFTYQVPAGYKYSTLLVVSDNVTSAMKLYGEILMKYYKKDHSYRKSDFSINYLGYS